jgi:hypothetical protein
MNKNLINIIVFIILLIIIYFLLKQYQNHKNIVNSEKFRSSLDIYYQNTVDGQTPSESKLESISNKNSNLNAIWVHVDMSNIYNSYFLVTNQKNDILYMNFVPINIINNTIGEEFDSTCTSYTLSAVGRLDLYRTSVSDINISTKCSSIIKKQKFLGQNSTIQINFNKSMINFSTITIKNGNNTYEFQFYKLQTTNSNFLDITSFQYNIPKISSEDIDPTNVNCPISPVATYACVIENAGAETGILSNTPMACATKVDSNGFCKKENVKCSVNSALTSLNINNTNVSIPYCSQNTNITTPYNNYITNTNIINNRNPLKDFTNNINKFDSYIIINNIDNKYYTLGYEFFGVNPTENYLINQLSWLNDYMNGTTNANKIAGNIELWRINNITTDNTLFSLSTIPNNPVIQGARPTLYPEFFNNGNTNLSLYQGGLEQQLYLENEKNILSSSNITNFSLYCGNLRTNNGLFIESNSLLSYNLGKTYRKTTLLSKPLQNSKWYCLGFNLNVKYDSNLVKKNYINQINNILLPILQKIKLNNYLNKC